ncbi:MAG: response regulator transcription factor [Acidiferrobacteraceae bacterium]
MPPGCILTRGQLEVVRGIASGETYGQIAQRTGRSASTVRQLLHQGYRRLGVPNGTQAAIMCWRRGWIVLDGDSPATIAPVAPPAIKPTAEQLKITPAQRVYLYAFDLYLTARCDDEKRAARAIMDRAARDAGIPVGGQDRSGLLIRHIGVKRIAQAQQRRAAA